MFLRIELAYCDLARNRNRYLLAACLFIKLLLRGLLRLLFFFSSGLLRLELINWDFFILLVCLRWVFLLAIGVQLLRLNWLEDKSRHISWVLGADFGLVGEIYLSGSAISWGICEQGERETSWRLELALYFLCSVCDDYIGISLLAQNLLILRLYV